MKHETQIYLPVSGISRDWTEEEAQGGKTIWKPANHQVKTTEWSSLWFPAPCQILTLPCGCGGVGYRHCGEGTPGRVIPWPSRRPARLAAKLGTTSCPVSGSHIAILCKPGVCTLCGVSLHLHSVGQITLQSRFWLPMAGKTRSDDWNSQKYSRVLTRTCMLFITKLYLAKC